MEIQAPYSASAMRSSYNPHVQQQQIAELYGQRGGLGYPFTSQYNTTANPFSQGFTGMNGIAQGYHTSAQTGREGKNV